MDLDLSSDSLVKREMDTRDAHPLVLGKRDVPRIGGSFGGFIALVICLIFIIIAASTAIYFVLRNDNDRPSRNNTNTDPERASRRHKYHQHTSMPSSSQYIYGESTSTPSRSWLTALGNMFSGSDSIKGHSRGATSASDSEGLRAKSRGGWMRTAGDEWDEDDAVPQSAKPSRLNLTNPSPAMSMAYSPGLDSPFRPPVITAVDSSSTYSSIPQGMGSFAYMTGRGEPEPVPRSPMSSGTASPVPVASPTQLRSTSPEPMSGLSPTTAEPQPRHIDPNRTLSVQTVQSVQSAVSNTSARTFSGGTGGGKFIEDI